MNSGPAIERMLVPLDGSGLAEAVLPATEALASRFSAQVILVHVLEKRPPATVHGDRHLMDADEASAYLDSIASRLRMSGLEVETHVHAAPEGDLAGSVVEHSEEFSPDLVVLCAHGSGGLRDFLFGGIAQQVLQRGTRPVLLIQPTASGGAPPFDPATTLVPLDGNPEHEAALPMAAMMTRAFGGSLDFVYVVPTLGTVERERAATAVLLPATTRALLEMDQQEAAGYLARVSRPYRENGLKVTAAVLRGDTVQSVLKHAGRVHAGLVALTSHGRVGLDALWTGSIGPRVTASAACPLLLVRA